MSEVKEEIQLDLWNKEVGGQTRSWIIPNSVEDIEEKDGRRILKRFGSDVFEFKVIGLQEHMSKNDKKFLVVIGTVGKEEFIISEYAFTSPEPYTLSEFKDATLTLRLDGNKLNVDAIAKAVA